MTQQKTTNNRNEGNKAEEIACNYLIQNGYKIIKRNFYFGKYGEIDIIAEKDEWLVFVEVKSRTSLKYGHPLESLTQGKIQKFRRAAEGYLFVNKISDRPMRCDFIAILLGQGKPDISHIENAF